MNLRFSPARHSAGATTETPSMPLQKNRELPTLITPRLTLRPLHTHDIDRLHAIFSDARAMRFWNQPPLRSPDDVSIYLEASQRDYEYGRLLQWGMTLTGHDQIIGLCHLAQIQSAQGRGDIGIVLAPAQWGHGYGLEALTALLDHAFGEQRLRRLEADVDARNLYYLKTLETLGFKPEGYLRQRWLVDGQARDSILLGLLGNRHRPHADIEAAPR